MLFVGIASSFTSMTNGGILQFGRFICCTIESAGSCGTSLLGFFQLAVQFIAFLPVYVLFLVYNPLKAKNRMQFVLSIVMFVVLILFCLIIAFVAIALMHEYGWDSGAAQGYATGLGYLTVAATVIQWMPQIITTLIRKSKGVLSVPMLLIQAPGTALVVIFQAGINRAALTTWLPFLFSCVQQTVLLIICFVFWFRDRRARKRVEIRPSLLVNADEASDEEEKMPLIEKAG
eukprot:TRINITY_DN1876_c0_g1_i1.p1 TRINITY_DN1876_c0_g1~~TRINITY_DN1876_c0_g1_i1.p1  ORF type:complete len:232 (-),score=33.13 TRINITY_DN1876_c0_g1_i1:58-753(-)